MDAAELRSYIRQHSFTSQVDSFSSYFEKPLDDWSMDEMQNYFCYWLGSNSEKCERKFEEYDKQGLGLLCWQEVFAMAEQAFSIVAVDDYSFTKTKRKIYCHEHDLEHGYAIDLKCFQCVLEEFDPTKPKQYDLVATFSSRLTLTTQRAAGTLKDSIAPTQTTTQAILQRTTQVHTPLKAKRRKGSTPLPRQVRLQSKVLSNLKPTFIPAHQQLVQTTIKQPQEKHISLLTSTPEHRLPAVLDTVKTPRLSFLAPKPKARKKPYKSQKKKRSSISCEALEKEAKMEAVFVYIKHNNVKEVRRLFRESGLCVNFKYRGVTPLHVAASNGKAEVITYLLSRGCDVNKRDSNGNLAVEICKEGDADIVDQLQLHNQT